MLTQTKNAPNRLVFQTQAWAAAVAAVIIAVVIAAAVLLTTWPSTGTVAWTSTKALADMLFGEYVLPFEVVSVLLTAAVVGGVLLARREPPPREEDRS